MPRAAEPRPRAVAPTSAPMPWVTGLNALPVRSLEVSAARLAAVLNCVVVAGPEGRLVFVDRDPLPGPAVDREWLRDDFFVELETDMPVTLVTLASPFTSATPLGSARIWVGVRPN